MKGQWVFQSTSLQARPSHHPPWTALLPPDTRRSRAALWWPPAATSSTAASLPPGRPCTLLGASLLPPPGLPSCPDSLQPNPQTSPLLRTRVCRLPATTCVTCCPSSPGTLCRQAALLVWPSPVWPQEPCPPAKTSPATSTTV